jgi:hypothetical protein
VRLFPSQLLHHIPTITLRRLRFNLPLQLVQLKFKPFDFNLQAIILLPYSFITRFYKYLLNLGRLDLITKSININIISPFTTFSCRGFQSFGFTWGFYGDWLKSVKLHIKILMCLLWDIMLTLKSTNWVLDTRGSLLALSKFLVKFLHIPFLSASFLSSSLLILSWTSNFSCSSRSSSLTLTWLYKPFDHSIRIFAKYIRERIIIITWKSILITRDIFRSGWGL